MSDRPPGDAIAKLRFDSLDVDRSLDSHFNGAAELRRLSTEPTTNVAHVRFPAGVRTDWHRHSGVQLLYFVEGQGEVADRDGRRLRCDAGDVVRVEPGASHWHGATPGQAATHIAVTAGVTEWEERPQP